MRSIVPARRVGRQSREKPDQGRPSKSPRPRGLRLWRSEAPAAKREGVGGLCCRPASGRAGAIASSPPTASRPAASPARQHRPAAGSSSVMRPRRVEWPAGAGPGAGTARVARQLSRAARLLLVGPLFWRAGVKRRAAESRARDALRLGAWAPHRPPPLGAWPHLPSARASQLGWRLAGGSPRETLRCPGPIPARASGRNRGTRALRRACRARETSPARSGAAHAAQPRAPQRRPPELQTRPKQNVACRRLTHAPNHRRARPFCAPNRA